ncbi:hypothetical protein GF342_03600 [Candidatus Woesearchaeota archaeon]|nr:hypothetical protein [Candidatus Woesearchaeota archaeon]
MAILGFGYKKIDFERKGPMKGGAQINHNANITDVQSATIKQGSASRDAARITFEFTANYEPEIASLKFEGELLWVDKPEQVKEALDGWTKDKKLSKEAMVPVYNTIFRRSLTQALIWTNDLNLPAPIRFPKVTAENAK